MNYIVFDLEWNQSPGGKKYSNSRLPFDRLSPCLSAGAGIRLAPPHGQHAHYAAYVDELSAPDLLLEISFGAPWPYQHPAGSFWTGPLSDD